MMLRYQPVRPSIRLSADFSLAMGSSPGFGSFASDIFALFTLGFPTAPSQKDLAKPLAKTRSVILQ